MSKSSLADSVATPAVSVLSANNQVKYLSLQAEVELLLQQVRSAQDKANRSN